jgi:hypothetical protein
LLGVLNDLHIPGIQSLLGLEVVQPEKQSSFASL